MFALAALVGIVPALLMIVGIISVFRTGVKLGKRRGRRNPK